jgi:hypothetical protein
MASPIPAAPPQFRKDLLTAPAERVCARREIRVLIDESVTPPKAFPSAGEMRGAREPSREANSPRLVLPASLAPRSDPYERGEEAASPTPLRPIASSNVAFSSGMLIPASNGFLNACHMAYSLHHTLRLSPDDIWLPIIQSIAVHTDKNAEQFRGGFVDFMGKAELIINVPPEFEAGGDDARVAWADLVFTFGELVQDHTRSDVVPAFAPDFSTSDSVSRTAASVAVMSAMKSFFEYTAITMCGIREVVLEGTPADWDALRARTAALAGLADGRLGADLHEWFNLVDGTLARIAETAHGARNVDFWSRIYSSYNPGGSGASTSFSGWALHFFLYDSGLDRIEHAGPLPMTGKEVKQRDREMNQERDPFFDYPHPDHFLYESSLPACVCCAPVSWQVLGGPPRALTFVSGSWSVGITPEGDLKPVTQWLIAEEVASAAGAV